MANLPLNHPHRKLVGEIAGDNQEHVLLVFLCASASDDCGGWLLMLDIAKQFRIDGFVAGHDDACLELFDACVGRVAELLA